MRRMVWLVARGSVAAAALVLSVLLPTIGHAYTAQFTGRDTSGNEYTIYRDFEVYIATNDDWECCQPMVPWCMWTTNDSKKLSHYHFLQDFTAQQQEDMDRYLEYHYTVEARQASASVWYNCHSFALHDYSWASLIDQAKALQYDYTEVAGTTEDPYEIGMVCDHNGAHSSVIIAVDDPDGQDPETAAAKVRGKWGAYGKYDSTPDASATYGPPTAVYRAL
ncbi:MAG: hypothetical protein HPY69_08585 [Armatimonadetes bacterium]|nr:hypothetical protein [Armatimonadota bacterium]